MLVISKSGGYPLWVIVSYSMSSVYYALVLDNRASPNLLFYQILLFWLHLTTYVNNLVIHPQKVRLQNLKLICSCLFLNATVKPLLKSSNLCLDSFSWNLENWESSIEKTTSSIPLKFRYFHCLRHALFYEPFQLDKSWFLKIGL